MTLIFAILRFVHIIAAIFWAGGALTMSFFIVPTIGATGDAGKQFAGHLMGKTRITPFMMIAGGTAVLAGSLLYGIDSNWFQSAWMRTPTGVAFGIGATSGILAFIFGLVLGRANMALAALGAQIQGKPTPEQMSAIQALQKRQALAAKGNMIFILIAMVMMESARSLK
jgi:uncharacterized membrane protein